MQQQQRRGMSETSIWFMNGNFCSKVGHFALIFMANHEVLKVQNQCGLDQRHLKFHSSECHNWMNSQINFKS